MLALLLACQLPASGPAAPTDGRPPGLPTDVVIVRVGEDGTLTADGAPVEPWKALDATPTDEDDGPLADALRPTAGRPLLVELPPDTAFWKLRKVLGSAKAAGSGSTWVAAEGSQEAFPLVAPPRYGLGGACKEPLPVNGAEPLVTLSLQTGADGAWVVANARFLPRVPRGPIEGLPPECLFVGGCDMMYPEGGLRAACESGAAGAAERVGLAGVHGCLLPIARTPDQVATWRAELPGLVGALGLGARDLTVVMPEARTRFDAILAVLGGYVDAGLRVPHVGTTLLVEGNDGPPVCNAEVRDAAALDAAGARWIGSLRQAPAPPPAPEPADGG